MTFAAILPAMSYPVYPKGSPGLWLGLSILNTVTCCFVFGIVGIVYASIAMAEEGRGNYYAAEKAALQARWWTIATYVLFAVFAVIGVVSVVLVKTSQVPEISQP